MYLGDKIIFFLLNNQILKFFSAYKDGNLVSGPENKRVEQGNNDDGCG